MPCLHPCRLGCWALQAESDRPSPVPTSLYLASTCRVWMKEATGASPLRMLWNKLSELSTGPSFHFRKHFPDT